VLFRVHPWLIFLRAFVPWWRPKFSIFFKRFYATFEYFYTVFVCFYTFFEYFRTFSNIFHHMLINQRRYPLSPHFTSDESRATSDYFAPAACALGALVLWTPYGERSKINQKWGYLLSKTKFFHIFIIPLPTTTYKIFSSEKSSIFRIKRAGTSNYEGIACPVGCAVCYPIGVFCPNPPSRARSWGRQARVRNDW